MKTRMPFGQDATAQLCFKHSSSVLRMVLVAAAISMPAFADILPFGPLVSTSQISMPANYGGFGWGPEWIVIPNGVWDGAYGNTYGAPSGGAASPGFGGLLTSGSPFTFLGADFTSWGINNSPAFISATGVTVTGVNAAGQVVGQVSMSLSTSSYNFLPADFQGVTYLQFQGTGGAGYSDFLMDDLTYYIGGR